MNQQKQNTTKYGYSLVELLFVMGMIFLLASISMVNYNQFGREVELENDAYNVALAIRTTQFFGINRKDDLSASFDEPKPYGIYFSIADSTPAGISDESFMMFIDNELASGAEGSNKLFDDNSSAEFPCIENSSSECFEIFTFNRGIYISDLCLGTNEADCAPKDPINDLHITFKRPNPDATIRTSSDLTEYSYAEITVSSPVFDVGSRKITVGIAGQISIK